MICKSMIIENQVIQKALNNYNIQRGKRSSKINKIIFTPRCLEDEVNQVNFLDCYYLNVFQLIQFHKLEMLHYF